MESKLHEALSSFQFEHQVIRIDANRRLYSFGGDVRAVVSMTPEGVLMVTGDNLVQMSIRDFLGSISNSAMAAAGGAISAAQRSSSSLLERAARGGPLHLGQQPGVTTPAATFDNGVVAAGSVSITPP